MDYDRGTHMYLPSPVPVVCGLFVGCSGVDGSLLGIEVVPLRSRGTRLFELIIVPQIAGRGCGRGLYWCWRLSFRLPLLLARWGTKLLPPHKLSKSGWSLLSVKNNCERRIPSTVPAIITVVSRSRVLREIRRVERNNPIVECDIGL